MKKVSILLAAAMIAALILGTCAGNITTWQRNKDVAHEAAELMRSYGYPEDNPIIQAASAWWWEQDAAEKMDVAEQTARDEMDEQVSPFPSVVSEEDAPVLSEADTAGMYYTTEQHAAHPVACEIYQYLRADMGLSEPVTIGLIAGWMEESGGQTLDIDPYVATGSGYYCYYGIACWSVYYCPDIFGADLQGQLDYFAQTVQGNMETFGGDYAYFCGLTDPVDAMAYYWSYYGRGYGYPSAQRIANCETARDFFCG